MNQKTIGAIKTFGALLLGLLLWWALPLLVTPFGEVGMGTQNLLLAFAIVALVLVVFRPISRLLIQNRWILSLLLGGYFVFCLFEFGDLLSWSEDLTTNLIGLGLYLFSVVGSPLVILVLVLWLGGEFD